MAFDSLFHTLTVLLVVSGPNVLDLLGDQGAENYSQLVGGGGGGCLGAEFSFRAAEELPQPGTIAVERMGREAEELSGVLLNYAGSAPQYLAAAFVVVRTQT